MLILLISYIHTYILRPQKRERERRGRDLKEVISIHPFYPSTPPLLSNPPPPKKPPPDTSPHTNALADLSGKTRPEPHTHTRIPSPTRQNHVPIVRTHAPTVIAPGGRKRVYFSSLALLYSTLLCCVITRVHAMPVYAISLLCSTARLPAQSIPSYHIISYHISVIHQYHASPHQS